MAKKTLAEKLRRKLQEYILPEKKEKKVFKGNLQGATSKINRRRKLLEESLKY